MSAKNKRSSRNTVTVTKSVMHRLLYAAWEYSELISDSTSGETKREYRYLLEAIAKAEAARDQKLGSSQLSIKC